MSVAERAISEKGIGEGVIGEQANLVTSDWEVVKIKNTQYSCSSYILVTDPIFEFLRSYNRTRCIVLLKYQPTMVQTHRPTTANKMVSLFILSA